MSLWRRLFGGPTAYCPACGLPTERYQQTVQNGGYVVTQEWRACPSYRAHGAGYSDHFGVWWEGDRRSAFDPATGKRRGEG